jgi:hypothetical protein
MTATREAKNIQATEDMAARQTKTAEAAAQKPAQAQPMADLVQKLVADGRLDSGEGKFTLMPDFSESLAMIDYIAPYFTGISPKNFVIRTDLAWEAASDKANWFSSGCGFIFHIGDDGSYYYASLALDGNVSIGAHKPNYHYVDQLGKDYYGKVKSYKSDLKYPSGMLAYSIPSGTHKDFGTRCTLTHVELWELK